MTTSLASVCCVRQIGSSALKHTYAATWTRLLQAARMEIWHLSRSRSRSQRTCHAKKQSPWLWRWYALRRNRIYESYTMTHAPQTGAD